MQRPTASPKSMLRRKKDLPLRWPAHDRFVSRVSLARPDPRSGQTAHACSGRRGTPRAVLERLSAEVQEAMKDPVVRARFVSLAVDIADPMTPDAFAACIQARSDRYAKLIPELGIANR